MVIYMAQKQYPSFLPNIYNSGYLMQRNHEQLIIKQEKRKEKST